MTHHIGYIYGAKLEAFSPPVFCQSGAGLKEYTYYYQKENGMFISLPVSR